MSNGITSGGCSSLGSILIVDDAEHITSLLKYNLENESYRVDVERDVRSALNGDLTVYRLILADGMNQQPDGYEFLQTVKANPMWSHIPVIIVTESDSEDDIIAAFNDGADDYIVKPFSLRELIARVKSVLRRNPVMVSPQGGGAIVTAGPLEIDLRTRTVRHEGNFVPLTKTEFAILALLARNKNTFFNRRQIYEAVWANGDYHDNDRTVDTNISRLRKKLGTASSVVINKSGMGYAIPE